MEKKINHNNINKIGGVAVFTISGAVEIYKKLAAICYNNLSMESSVALADAADTLHGLGFSWDEIEAFELQAI